MATKKFNKRQLKKFRKQRIYFGEKKYRIIRVHSLEETWFHKMYEAIENNEQCTTYAEAIREVNKLPIGSYIIWYDNKSGDHIYEMKNRCDTCSKGCGSHWSDYYSRFNKLKKEIFFKKRTNCELKNSLLNKTSSDNI